MRIYHNPPEPCSPETIGTVNGSTLEPIVEPKLVDAGDITLWSKVPQVSEYDKYMDTYCLFYFGSTSEHCTQQDKLMGTCNTPSATYAFCSEKGDKRVAMCLNQEVNNPDIAQHIFSSFRWLDPSDIFHDVPVDHEHADALQFLKERSVLSGYEDNTFRPNDPLNRAEFSKIITKAAYDEEPTGEGCFPDVQNEWFAPFVCLLHEKGVIDGYPSREFLPGENVSFVEAAKMVSEAYNLPLGSARGDTPWYEPYVQALAEKNAIPLSIDALDTKITRGEMAEMIYRIDSETTDLPSGSYEDLK